MATLRQKTENDVQTLRFQGFEVIEIWEQRKKDDSELQSFLRSHSLQDTLNQRDAFLGGRTNVAKLFHKGNVK